MSRLLGNPVASAVIGTDEPPCLAKGQVPLGSESVAGINSCRRPSQTGRFSDRIRQFFCDKA